MTTQKNIKKPRAAGYDRTAPPHPKLSQSAEEKKLAQTILDGVAAWRAKDWGKNSNSAFGRFLRWAAEQIEKLD